MKNIVDKIVLIGFLLVSCNVMLSQSAKQILTKLNKTYENKSYQMNYKVTFSNNNSTVNTYSGSIAKDKRLLYLNTTDELTIINGDYHVYVNKLEKAIFVNEIPKEKNFNTIDPISNIDTLISKGKAKLSYSGKDFYVLEIDLKESDSYFKMELTVNKRYELIGCSYFLNNQQYPFDRIHIQYSKIQIGKSINKKFFSTKSVFKRIKNQLVPVEAYKNYELVDNRNIKNHNP